MVLFGLNRGFILEEYHKLISVESKPVMCAIKQMNNVFVFGPPQSVVARALLSRIQEAAGYVPVYINFSAQTSSSCTQEIIESKLEKKRKNVLGMNHRVIFMCLCGVSIRE